MISNSNLAAVALPLANESPCCGLSSGKPTASQVPQGPVSAPTFVVSPLNTAAIAAAVTIPSCFSKAGISSPQRGTPHHCH